MTIENNRLTEGGTLHAETEWIALSGGGEGWITTLFSEEAKEASPFGQIKVWGAESTRMENLAGARGIWLERVAAAIAAKRAI